MGLFSQFWSWLGDTPSSRHEAVDASRRGEAIQLQAIMLQLARLLRFNQPAYPN
jgi:hypothetical protein